MKVAQQKTSPYMSLAAFPADPALPQIEVASDSKLMLEVFQKHLRPLAEGAYHIRDCHLSRIRYRRAARCFLQYTLRLVEAGTGHERCQLVTGAIYAEQGRAERIARKLRAAGPIRAISEAALTFEPVSFIPELKMLVQVFPYDRRLPSLPLLMAGPPPALERLLLTQFGPGDWQAEACQVELVRYREQLGAVLKYSVLAQEAKTSRSEEKRFYLKHYRGEQGGRTYQALQALRRRAEAGESFTVGRPIAYMSNLRTLILEEASGTSLEQVLLGGDNVDGAARKVAKALAALHQGELTAERHHLVRDQVAVLERAGKLLKWICPHLGAEVEMIIGTIAASLEDVPLRPTHRDLKLDHIFLDGDRVIFIDLDSLAGADPVLDPALLLARFAAISSLFSIPRDRLRRPMQAFADEYFGRVPTAWRGRLAPHYAGALIEAAASFFRRQEPDWHEKVGAFVNEARDSLAGSIW